MIEFRIDSSTLLWTQWTWTVQTQSIYTSIDQFKAIYVWHLVFVRCLLPHALCFMVGRKKRCHFIGHNSHPPGTQKIIIASVNIHIYFGKSSLNSVIFVFILFIYFFLSCGKTSFFFSFWTRPRITANRNGRIQRLNDVCQSMGGRANLCTFAYIITTTY